MAELPVLCSKGAVGRLAATVEERMNIFETIERTTSRIEPFHSRFLADALIDSIGGDRSLFDAVWRITTPKGWDVPKKAIVVAEEDVSGQGRIDVLIKCDSPELRVVGIEVKTTGSSATEGQLQRYHKGLTEKFSDHEIAVAYLTPFNRQWAGDQADALPTVKEYDEFRQIDCTATHISWLDIAAIPWNGNELWRQHQLYVYQHISSQTKLRRMSTTRDRSLDQIFGEKSVDDFWEALRKLGIEPSKDGDTIIELAKHDDVRDFAKRLGEALRILITKGDGVSRNANKRDDFPECLRHDFLDSEYRKVHEALFGLSGAHSHVWVKGEMNYGVRVAHENHSVGVSLVGSDGVNRLKIVGRR